MINCGNNVFETIISCETSSYYCKLYLPHYPSFQNASLHSSWNLQLILKEAGKGRTWITSFCSTEEFVSSVESLIRQRRKSRKVFPYTFYNRVIEEINAIGLEASINRDFSSVELSHADNAGRIHSLVIALPEKYPEESVTIARHELPLNINSTLGENQDFSAAKTILDAYRQFKCFIEIYQAFWDALEIFDASCWILDPAKPSLADITRRIKISNDCTALLTFNPYKARQCPNIEFRGVEREVEKHRNALANNLLEDRWDMEVDIHLNLITVLNLECLPVKEGGAEEDDFILRPGDCGICFEDKLDGEPARIRCENSKCESQYHEECLLRYLSTNLQTVRMKNAIIGKCPTCRKTIGCTNVEFSDV